MIRVGVVAIQGDFERHISAVSALNSCATEVRVPEDLTGLTHLIIPGGESTTVGKLMQRFGLGDAIIERADDLAIWGTCMGMILLAKRVEGKSQYTLKLLDIDVQRNAFGAQVHSFERPIPFSGLKPDPMGVFIRAPIVTRCGPEVEVLSEIDGKVVAVRQKNLLGTSFHPELTDDLRILQTFLA